MFRTHLIAAIGLLCGLALTNAGIGSAAPQPDLVVSPRGNDTHAGTAERPFATFQRAQQAVQQLLLHEPQRRRPVVVEFQGGTYWLSAPILITPHDSGTSDAPVIYRAADGQRPVFSGGVRIDGWKVDAAGRWQVSLPEVKAGEWNFIQLFVNDQRRLRPRLPRTGYYRIAGELPPSHRAAAKGFDRFRFSQGELNPRWTSLGDVEIVAAQTWQMSRLRIDSIDAGDHAVHLLGRTPGSADWFRFTPGNRYFVENVKEALHEPGQWYLDRPSGELVYIPLPAERPDGVTVVAPRLANLLRLSGRPDRGAWVEHIEFRGLTFAHANWATPRDGQAFYQAEANLDGAIAAAGCRRIRIADCTVRQVGAYAIELGAACQENIIENCDLVDLGAGGVKIGVNGDQPNLPAWAESPRCPPATGNVVRDCTIAHGGRLHPAGVGVWIGDVGQTTVEHNDIYDFYYTGISVGWVWGYGPSKARNNRISHNHIHTLGQGVLSDLSGVYTLGVSTGTVIDHNRIHDVEANQYGGWGLYCDEGSTGIQLHDNMVYRTSDGGFHQHFGRDNLVEQNILALGRRQQLSRSKAEEHNSFTLRHNIIYWTGPEEALSGDWKRGFNAKMNVYWNARGAVRLAGQTLKQRQQVNGQDIGSVVADPLFIAPEQGDFRMREGSPSVELGIRPHRSDACGRRTKSRQADAASRVPRTFP